MPLALANLAANGPIPHALQARSSVGERFLDTEEAGGSIPPVPSMLGRTPVAARQATHLLTPLRSV